MIADILESMGEIDKPRLVELGKIKIGGLGAERTAASGNKYRVPQKQDHFTITTLQRLPNGDLMPDKALMDSLIAEHGDADGKLRQIPIRLLSDDIEDVLQVAYCFYGKKSCGARSDGKTVTWYIHPETFKPLEEPFEEPFTPEHLERRFRDAPMFKLHSVFNCVIAAKDSRWGGVYKFRTTSVVSFKQLYSSLVHIGQLTGGVLINMPLMLRVRPLQVSPNGQTTTVYVVHVELMGRELFEIQQLALTQAQYKTTFREKLQIAQRQYRALLTGPGQESNGEASSVADEFHPDAPDLETPLAPPGGYDLIDGFVQDEAALKSMGETPVKNEATAPAPVNQPQQQPDEAPKVANESTNTTFAGDLKMEWEVFVAERVEQGEEKGVPADQIREGIKAVALRVGVKGKEWKMPTDIRKKIYEEIEAGTGHFQKLK